MLKFGTFEVQENPYAEFCDPQVVYHPPTFVVGNPVDYLRINDDRSMRNKVRDELADPHAFVGDDKHLLLVEGDPAKLKFDDQRILIDLLCQTMSDRVEDFNSQLTI